MFTSRGNTYPKVMGNIVYSMSRSLKLHISKSNWTYGHGEIKGWENSRGGGGGGQNVYLPL